MTAEDRCTAEYPHPAHRTQYGPFGVKDCPGVPITPANAPAVPDGPAPASGIPRKTTTELALADLERRVGELEDRVDEHLTPSEYDPADDEDDQAAVQNLLDDSTKAFAAADTSSERVEVIRDLLAGWYAAWPSTAVTDPHEGIAWQLASLISTAEARASEHGDAGQPTLALPGLKLTGTASGGHIITVTANGTWTLEHPAVCELDAAMLGPDACRLRQLAEQQLPDVQALKGAIPPGRYECWVGQLGDVFLLGDRVDQADGCPCLPGAPPHVHGAGGYAPDHPHTDPGDGRTECEQCGKWVWPAIHSCKGVPVTERARARHIGDRVDQAEEG